MNYQIQAVTWRGGIGHQQDAMLICDKIYHHKGMITKSLVCDAFCVAVADGVATSPYSARAARTLVGLAGGLYREHGVVDFAHLQDRLNAEMADFDGGHANYLGAASTLVCAYTQGDDVAVRHLGDSRAYHYDGTSWQCLTKDHSFINELKADGVADGDDYASCYDALTGYFVVDDMADMTIVEMASHQVLNLKQGECLLLCSDGFCDVLDGKFLPIDDKTVLKDWLSDGIKLIKNLAKKSHSSCDLDNVTAVLVRCVG